MEILPRDIAMELFGVTVKDNLNDERTQKIIEQFSPSKEKVKPEIKERQMKKLQNLMNREYLMNEKMAEKNNDLMDQQLKYISNNNQVLKCSMRLKDAMSGMTKVVRSSALENAKAQSEYLRKKENHSRNKFKKQIDDINQSFGY